MRSHRRERRLSLCHNFDCNWNLFHAIWRTNSLKQIKSHYWNYWNYWKINNLGALSVLMARINLKKNKSALDPALNYLLKEKRVPHCKLFHPTARRCKGKAFSSLPAASTNDCWWKPWESVSTQCVWWRFSNVWSGPTTFISQISQSHYLRTTLSARVLLTIH